MKEDTFMALLSRGRFIWREEFYSICSKHQKNKSDCDMCSVGSWTNVYKQRIGHLVFRLVPGIWRWNANRKGLEMEMRDSDDEWIDPFPNLRPRVRNKRR